MAFDFTPIEQKLEEAQNWLKTEFAGLRTGQAAPAVLDGIRIDSYGTLTPINQVGSVSIEGARSLYVSVWDKSQIKALEKAITDANLGLSTQATDDGVRVLFPELTAESRETLKKTAKKKLEDARVSVRQAREETWDEIQEQAKNSEITEDDKFRFKEELQKRVDATNKELDEITSRKEKEIEN